MPTGLTAPIQIDEDYSFSDFAKKCAQRVGYFASLRDDENIPDKIEVSMYHNKELSKAKDALKKFESMSDQQRRKMAIEEIENKIKQLENSIIDAKELEKRYRAMRAKIEAWEPPTSSHEPLKKMMLEQIDQSIQYDCLQDWAKERLADLQKITPSQWAENHMKDLKKSVEYHQKEWESDKRQAEQANEWLQAFYKSLPAD